MLVRTYALGLSAQGRNGLHDTVNQLLQKSNIQRQVRESGADLSGVTQYEQGGNYLQ